jgi:peptide-methionine (R)-S-oxide reductase
MTDIKTEPGSGEIVKSDAEWRSELTPMQYAVLREKTTERPFIGEYDHSFDPGTYVCAGCGQPLFESDAKFDSGCGWPAFAQPVGEVSIDEECDVSHGMVRTEVLCSKCQGHLRPRLSGWSWTNRTALLHQLGGTEASAEVTFNRT